MQLPDVYVHKYILQYVDVLIVAFVRYFVFSNYFNVAFAVL